MHDFTSAHSKMLGSIAASSQNLLAQQRSDLTSGSSWPEIQRSYLELDYRLLEAQSNPSFLDMLSRHPRTLNAIYFGKKKEINRVVMKRLIGPCLRKVTKEYKDLELFSLWDHYLFKPHLQLEDSPSWFSEAFWDVNSHAVGLATEFLHRDLQPSASTRRSGPVVFVFKGQPSLAHYFNLERYLHKACKMAGSNNFRVIFLDVLPDESPSLACKAFCLGGLSAHSKLSTYARLLADLDAKASIWVAAAQNLGLYMFSRFCALQGYWSMKYHSVFSSTIDLYLKTSTLSTATSIDGGVWHGMPCDLEEFLYSSPSPSKSRSSSDYRKSLVSGMEIRAVTLGREIKINNPQYESVVISLLSKGIQVAYSGREKSSWHSTIESQLGKGISHLGWLSRDEIVYHLQRCTVYLDSFPFGGGHTCFYALAADRPVLMLDTVENRRCSFMMHLLDIASFQGIDLSCSFQMEALGIFAKASLISEFLMSCAESHKSLNKLATIQENQKNLFERWHSSNPFEEQLCRSLRMLGIGDLPLTHLQVSQ